MVAVGSNGFADEKNTIEAKGKWYPVEVVAPFLGMDIRVLRQMIARKAQQVGRWIQAEFDGIVARKIQGRWKVWLDSDWTSPLQHSMGEPAKSTGRGGKDKSHAGA